MSYGKTSLPLWKSDLLAAGDVIQKMSHQVSKFCFSAGNVVDLRSKYLIFESKVTYLRLWKTECIRSSLFLPDYANYHNFSARRVAGCTERTLKTSRDRRHLRPLYRADESRARRRIVSGSRRRYFFLCGSEKCNRRTIQIIAVNVIRYNTEKKKCK